MSQKKAPRKRTPPDIETAVLAKSARRCTLCFHLRGELSEKLGQITHLDDDRSNGAEDNLAWMCLEHHSLYDSRTKQHKNYTIHEVKASRAKLYDLVDRGNHLAPVADVAAVRAEAAQQSLKSSSAWVSVSEIKPVDYGQGVFGFHLRVKNLGASLAHSISLNVQTEFQRPVIDEFIKAAFGKAQPVEFSVLTAGEMVSWEIRQAFTDDEIRDIKLGKRRFYVYGRVTYRDVLNGENTNRFNYLLSLTPPITFLARGVR
jgi:hypothetical protein